ncbi:MAG: YitT family protein [bacterium]|nr:YitT family protein [Mycoplasmatota bacterium]MDD6757299.1 YitT family protein [bacterium]MDY2907979.1 YitT family protein [Candidatus Faecimonas sp.]
MRIFSKPKDLKILEKINSKSTVKRHIQFVLGCFLIAVSYNLFLAPNNIVAGGVGGFAIIINYLTGIENFIVILIADALLLILSYFLLGKKKTKATILGSILFPLFVSLTSDIGRIIEIDTNQLLLISVFGGVVYGFGAGMIYKAGFTTGGTDIINQIISKYLKISMGNSMLYCDGTIVLLTAFVFGPTHFMYSIIVLYVISFMSDRVILGVSDSKAFYIVTQEESKIKEYIIKYLNHGVTVFNAKGGYAKENQTVLMCVLPTKDYYKLKEGIHEIDPNSFFVVTDAYEVFGGE